MYGDPKLFLSDNGVDIAIDETGFPIMETGLENLALISLYTEQDHPFNAIASSDIETAGSDFIRESEQPITKSQLSRIEDAAEKAFDKSIDASIIKSADATISIDKGTYKMELILTPPTGESQKLIYQKYNQLWINQSL